MNTTRLFWAILVASMVVPTIDAPGADARYRSNIQIRDPFILPMPESQTYYMWGHGMIFKAFDGRLLMAIHQPNEGRSRARLYEIEDVGDTLRILREVPFTTTE